MLSKYKDFIQNIENAWRETFKFYSIYELSFVNELIDYIEYTELDFPEVYEKVQNYIEEHGEDVLIRNFVSRLLDMDCNLELSYETVSDILNKIIEE